MPEEDEFHDYGEEDPCAAVVALASDSQPDEGGGRGGGM